MKALTVQQPYASAIVTGPKTGENRTWAPSLKQLAPGDWVAIHAGAALYKAVKQKHFTEAYTKGIPPLWPECPAFDKLPRGAVIGVARLRAILNSEFGVAHNPDFNPWYVGPFVWEFDHRITLPSPMPCKGALGLWSLPPDIEAACRLTIAEAGL